MKPMNKPWIMIICCVYLCGFAPIANAADMFMEIADMVGESEDALHPGWIDVLSLQWSLDAAATSDKRGVSGEISDIEITTAADAASPYLALAAMQGKSFDTIDFEFVGADGQVVRTLRLSNVLIKSLNSKSQRDGDDTESWTLNYTTIQWTYYPVDREQAPSEFIWTRTGGN